MNLSEQCLSFLRHPGGESIEQVIDRGLRWLEATLEHDGEGMAALVNIQSREHLAAVVSRARKQLEPALKRTGWVLEHRLRSTEKQLGAPLPASLKRFWSIIGADAALREAVEAFTRLQLRPERSRPGSSGVWNPVLQGGSHAHEDLDGEYGGWFAKADPAHQLRKGRDWKKLDAATGVMLDPAFAPSLVRLGGRDGEWRHAVTALRDERGECPVFSGGDDFEGFSYKLGDDVAAWLAAELDETLRSVRAQLAAA